MVSMAWLGAMSLSAGLVTMYSKVKNVTKLEGHNTEPEDHMEHTTYSPSDYREQHDRHARLCITFGPFPVGRPVLG